MAEDPGSIDKGVVVPGGAADKTKGEDFGTIELMIPEQKEEVPAPKVLTISEVAGLAGTDDDENGK